MEVAEYCPSEHNISVFIKDVVANPVYVQLIRFALPFNAILVEINKY